MGVDKAEMCLGGRTLLEIAIGKLQSLASEVVVVGQRQAVPDGLRVIADLRPGCGPMGGMEAALLDLNAGSGVENGSAVFLPVDMPFLPAGLLARMVGAWAKIESSVCMAIADGRVQPLVSLVRAEIITIYVRAALHKRSLQSTAGARGSRESAIGAGVHGDSVTAERGSVWPWMDAGATWSGRPANCGSRISIRRRSSRWRRGLGAREGRCLIVGIEGLVTRRGSVRALMGENRADRERARCRRRRGRKERRERTELRALGTGPRR